MKRLAVDVRRELGQFVQPALLLAPVELPEPVVGQLPQVVQVRAVVPSRAVDLVGPACSSDPAAQVVQVGFRYVYAKRLCHAAFISPFPL